MIMARNWENPLFSGDWVPTIRYMNRHRELFHKKNFSCFSFYTIFPPSSSTLVWVPSPYVRIVCIHTLKTIFSEWIIYSFDPYPYITRFVLVYRVEWKKLAFCLFWFFFLFSVRFVYMRRVLFSVCHNVRPQSQQYLNFVKFSQSLPVIAVRCVFHTATAIIHGCFML